MSRRRRPYLGQSPTSPGWWMRLWMAASFTFCVNYVPIHLAVETHLHHSPVSINSTSSRVTRGVEVDHRDHAEQHVPHFASDHWFRLAPQTATQLFSVDLLAAGTEVAVFTPQPQQQLFLTERQNPPGQFLRGPSQPRAPPTV